MNILKGIFTVVVIFVVIFALSFLGNEWDIFSIHYWGVRKENVRREVFEQTQSYVQGKKQDLVKYHHEWMKAPADEKAAIESTVRMAFAEFDESKFIDTPELYNFLKKCKYN
jgi:hypothetical protein